MSDDFPTFRRIGKAVPQIPGWVASHYRKTTSTRLWTRVISPLWRFTKKASKVTAVLIIILLLVHTTLGIVWKMQLNSALDEIHRKGEPVRWTDLVQKPVPDRENAAIIFKKAFKSLENGRHPNGHEPNAFLAFMNGEDYAYERSFDSLTYAKTDDPNTFEAKAREELPRQEETLRLIDVALSKPKCRFDTHWQDGISTHLRHLGPMKRLCRLEQANAISEAREGNVDAELKSLCCSLKIADILREEPAYYSFYIRTQCIDQTLHTLQVISRSLPLTSDQCRSIYDAISNPELDKHLKLALLGDRVEYMLEFQRLRYDSIECASLILGDDHGFRMDISKPFRYIWRPLSYKDEQSYVSYTAPLIKATALPYKEFVRKYPSDNIAQIPKYARFSKLVCGFSSYSSTWARKDTTKAEIGLAQTAMALKAYKNKFKAYPASITELGQKLGWKIPNDPFTGKDFVYTRRDKGFLLYSFARNLRDDHGRTLKEAGESKDYDIVWRAER